MSKENSESPKAFGVIVILCGFIVTFPKTEAVNQ